MDTTIIMAVSIRFIIRAEEHAAAVVLQLKDLLQEQFIAVIFMFLLRLSCPYCISTKDICQREKYHNLDEKFLFYFVHSVQTPYLPSITDLQASSTRDRIGTQVVLP